MDTNKLAVKVFNDAAQIYQDKYMDVSHYSDSFSFFCRNIEGLKPKVLELACGPGNVTKHLLNLKPSLQILATDLAENMLVLAKKNNPSVETQILDCRKIAALQSSFDAIMCAFCLPYLSKEETFQLIKDSSHLLNTNGIIYLSTMEDDYDNSGLVGPSTGEGPSLYMYFHQSDYIIKELKANNFDILYHKTQDIVGQEKPIPKDLMIIARKLG